MQPAGGQPDDGIPGSDFISSDYIVFLHHPDDEAGQVVVTLAVETGHLRRLPADESAADIAAGGGQSPRHRLHLPHRQLTHGDIVQKEQRLGAAGEYVIDAVVDDVHPHGIVLVQSRSQLQLGAHAVHAGHQHRPLVALQLE